MDHRSPIIVWFRQDLRLQDNPALAAAVEAGAPILPIYILDDESAGAWKMGAASRWWLHHSLRSLSQSLGGKLCVLRGDARAVIDDLVMQSGARAVYWNRCYEPWRVARDRKIKASLGERARSFNGSFLFEPHQAIKEDGMPYKVFTPFYKKGCLGRLGEPRAPIESAKPTRFFDYGGLDIDALGLLPRISWDQGFYDHWTVGEDAAHDRLSAFLAQGLKGYKEGRNFPDLAHVSRLSPHLHFGEISPHQAWHAARQAAINARAEGDCEHFLSELGWREFSHNLLYHFSGLPHENLQPKFDHFPWHMDDAALRAWQTGMTGVPIVDAGMRELWHTGYMHNRVRMIVGSFLVKNLRLHWRHGAAWFWDTLVDADLANNSASWQWIAGCGADAAPYFRIFNPVTQGQKFDASGAYVRKYVPELRGVSDKYLHNPWDAPFGERAKDYPPPIVDLKQSRQEALDAFATLKGFTAN